MADLALGQWRKALLRHAFSMILLRLKMCEWIIATEKTRAYFGGRLGYIHSHVHPGDNDDGVLVQPVLGFGYEPVNNIMFGAEAFVEYRNSDNAADKTYGTGTNLFVRYFFGS